MFLCLIGSHTENRPTLSCEYHMFILRSPARVIVRGNGVDSYRKESSEFSILPVLPNECHQTKLHFQNLSNRLIDLIENEDLANIPSPDRVEWITNWVYLFWDSVERFRVFESFVQYFVANPNEHISSVEIYSHCEADSRSRSRF